MKVKVPPTSPHGNIQCVTAGRKCERGGVWTKCCGLVKSLKVYRRVSEEVVLDLSRCMMHAQNWADKHEHIIGIQEFLYCSNVNSKLVTQNFGCCGVMLFLCHVCFSHVGAPGCVSASSVGES